MAAATADRRRGQLGPARASLEAALEVAPGAAAAHADLAEVLLEQGQGEAAHEHAKRAIELEGETPRTAQLLARAHEAAGRTAQAQEPPGWSERLGAAWRAWRRK
jgi:predicted Zn-dependent protease